jgi:hypothetical protein
VRKIAEREVSDAAKAALSADEFATRRANLAASFQAVAVEHLVRSAVPSRPVPTRSPVQRVARRGAVRCERLCAAARGVRRCTRWSGQRGRLSGFGVTAWPCRALSSQEESQRTKLCGRLPAPLLGWSLQSTHSTSGTTHRVRAGTVRRVPRRTIWLHRQQLALVASGGSLWFGMGPKAQPRRR